MRHHARPWFGVLCGAAFMLAGTPAAAQGIARSFYQLQVLVRPGDTVHVVGGSGREVRGRIDQLTDTTLRVIVGSQPEDFAQDEVVRILQRRSDSLGNGALWGLGIGAGLIGAAVLADPPGGNDRGWAVLAALAYGGIGAGVGTGIDAIIRRESVIFERQSVARAPRFEIAPMAGHGRRGMMLAVRF